MTKKLGKAEVEITVTLLSDKEQVLRVYPYAVCKKQPMRPWTRRSGLYLVTMEPGGGLIAAGVTAALAWNAAFAEMKKCELKDVL